MSDHVVSPEELVELCEEALAWQRLAELNVFAPMATPFLIREGRSVQYAIGRCREGQVTDCTRGDILMKVRACAGLWSHELEGDRNDPAITRIEMSTLSRKEANLLLPKELRMPSMPSHLTGLVGFARVRAREVSRSGDVSRGRDVVLCYDGLSACETVIGWELRQQKDIQHCMSDRERDVLFSCIDNIGMVARAREEDWTVALSAPGGADVALASDAEGARDFVRRTSDLKGGAKLRRQALVHWVREHFRQRRGTTDKALVRAHLRGASRVQMFGMAAHIVPSYRAIALASNGSRYA